MQAQQAARGGARQAQLEPIRLEEVVETDVVTAQRDTPISDVVSEMGENDVGSVVIVEDGRPVGVLTDRKIALALEDDTDVGRMEADDLIDHEGELITGTTDMTIFDALERLNDGNVRRLPVVDEEGELEGIVTLDDVLVLFGESFDRATEIIEAQSPRL